MPSNLPIIVKPTSYNYDFKKNNNLKEIYNQWDIFIDWSINQGNSHYSFTINYPNNDIHNLFYYTDIYKNVLKLHPLDKKESFFFGNNNSKYIDFEYLERDFKTEPSWFDDIHHFLYGYKHKIKTQHWIFTVIEENENGIPHIHGIIAIRNLIDYNKNIINNITKEFKKEYTFVDIVMKNLDNFFDIKGWIRYLHQNNQWIFKPLFCCLPKDINFINNIFLKCYITNYNMNNLNKENINSIQDNIKEYDNPCIEINCTTYSEQVECFEDNKLINKYNVSQYFIGIKLNKNELNENLIIDLICNYMYINNLYLNNNSVYKKINNTIISYERLETIDKLFFENFQNTVIPFYTNNFPIQFDGFDFYYIVKNFKLKMENNITKIKLINNNKIDFNFNIMEFNDGIYDLRNNLFIERNKLNSIKYKINTIKYYNKSYNRVRKDKPNNWINGVKNALGNNNVDFIVLCLFIANLFQPTNENIKRNFLFIHGPSNTGKTTYSSKILTRYFRPENIGSIVTDSNFKFQDINNKLFVILEEFKYKRASSSDFLKLLGGEKLLTSKKYSKDHITIDCLKGLIVSNDKIDEKNLEIKKALLNRLFIINFLNKNLNSNKEINESLMDEEPQIIIYCNKLYFKYFNKKQKRSKLVSSEYTNKSLTYKNKSNMSLIKFIFNGVLGKINNTKDNTHLKKKYWIHTTSIFNTYEWNNGILEKKDNNISLTNTTSPTPKGNGWEVGLLPNGKTQYFNKDYIGKFDNKTLEFLKKNQSTEKNSLNMVNDIENVINNNNINLEKVCDDLSIIFHKKVINNHLWECIQTKSMNGKCLNYYKIAYGDNWIEIAQQLIDITIYK